VIILDTTVLAYAVGDRHELREPSRSILQAHARGELEATTTVEVLQEFMRIRSRRRSRADAAELTRRYAEAFDIIPVTGDDLVLGSELFVRYPALGAFDSVLAAVALNRRAEALVSADRAFAGIDSLPWVDLAGDGARALSGPSSRR
jgi:uncharacterized protein